MHKFENIRYNSLVYWLKQTKRNISIQEQYANSFECDWQNQFLPIDPSKMHFSVFCSMGDWNTNITDHLEDVRYDEHLFSSEDDKDVLFRYYTRLFLLVSEILTDFQDVLTVFRFGRLSGIDFKRECKINCVKS